MKTAMVVAVYEMTFPYAYCQMDLSGMSKIQWCDKKMI